MPWDRNVTDQQRLVIDAVTKELIERGCIIEAGWRMLEIMAVPADAPALQRSEMRKAFFAGAQHLYEPTCNG